ncbi:MAG: hypothetical protein J6S67_03565 [Methanobrevibacter sp.]|nr:hypothetical protein [Methanobrevibacter sp.]
MKVLVACEESQRVCTAFREKGHEAYSCDILEMSGGHPEWHIQADVRDIINTPLYFSTFDGVTHYTDKWDLLIAHPPCTYLTVTGNKYYNVDVYGEQAEIRAKNRELAVDFFMMFVNANVDKICIENPVGIMSTRYRKPNQYIEPYFFGDPVAKKTGLWLKNLTELYPTNKLDKPERIYLHDGNSMDMWYYTTSFLPPAERSRERSKTFPGIAKAMAEQWG